ncbi:hypothetical protein OG401_41180 [Kitasatospora purpeofusca]|uniref:hypothetical protein n=1 Tax=Kitasatospora purpeofusca TaxID=67352 RepID=UPI00224DF8CA|nr:hypothetical protein [Kitasatospora purpeofusca]MCX4690634.1 hypothetical protein [Kitasatospora purpeofusca]
MGQHQIFDPLSVGADLERPAEQAVPAFLFMGSNPAGTSWFERGDSDLPRVAARVRNEVDLSGRGPIETVPGAGPTHSDALGQVTEVLRCRVPTDETAAVPGNSVATWIDDQWLLEVGEHTSGGHIRREL